MKIKYTPYSYIYLMYIATYLPIYMNLYLLCYLDLAVELDSHVQLQKDSLDIVTLYEPF